MPSHLTVTLHGWTLWGAYVAAACAVSTVLNVIACLAAGAWKVWKSLRRCSLPPVPAGPCVPDEPEILTAHAWGDSMDGLREDALRRGHGWFGPDARLKILEIRSVSSSIFSEPKPRTAYRAEVLVCCLPAAAEQVPALDGAR